VLDRPTQAGCVSDVAIAPPNDLEAEASLLGAMLLAPAAVEAALEVLSGSDFYKPTHGHIFDAITALHADGQAVDPVTVAAKLRDVGLLDDVGGAVVLVSLQANTPSTSSAPRYAHIIREHAVRRRLMGAATELYQRAGEGDIDEAIAVIEGAQAALTEGADGLGWEDVAAVLRGEIEEVTPELLFRDDNVALIYPGLTHWLMGEPGKGKTWVALEAVNQTICLGRDVIYLDWEGNRRIIGARLKALGLDAESVAEHLLYLRPGHVSPARARAMAKLVAEREVALVVCDGVAKALATQGLNEDKAPEVLEWLNLLPNQLADAGAAVLMLDHVTKDREGRGLWARGSGAKLGEVSGAAWSLRSRESFSRHQAGRVQLVQAKDREGHVGTDGSVVANIEFTPHGEFLRIEVRAPDASAEAPFGSMKLEMMSRALEGLPEPISQRKWLELTSGDRNARIAAIALLVQDGYAELVVKGQGHQYRTLRPYRESEPEPEPEGEPEEAF
jgi:hypothetical protein